MKVLPESPVGSAESAPAEGRSSGPEAGPATLVALVMSGALFCALSVATERGFPYWDFAAYHNDTLTAASQFRSLRAQGGGFTAPLFAVPLIPWVLLLGDSRLVYILAVYFTYFVPYLLVVVAIAKRVWPERSRSVANVAAAATLATPACWSHVLQGYPDVAGAALIAACVLLYGQYTPGGSFLVPVKIGVLAGLSVVLRRHYAYALVALYAGMVLDGLARALAGRHGGSARFPLFRHVLATAVSGAAALGLIALVNRQFFVMAMNTTRGEMTAYEHSVAATLLAMVATVGGLPLVLAALGWLSLSRRGTPWPFELRLVAMGTVAWVVIWAIQARQQPYHYPHFLPLFVVIGLVCLWSTLAQITSPWMRRSARAASVSLVAAGWILSMPLLATSLPSTTRLRIFPDRVQRSSNPAYVAIVDLVQTLRAVTRGDDAVLVAASSSVLNFDILRSAEGAIYGRDNARLNVLASPQVDSQTLPTDMLLQAQVVVVAEPFQHSLAAEYQKVVRVLVEAFREQWPISKDFALVPSTFPLPEGGEIRVYQRRRPSSPEVAADTFRRIETFVLGHALERGNWLVRSDFPARVTRDVDGTVRVTTHPARASAQSPTRVTLAGGSPQAGVVSATVSFYDTRCQGIQVVAIVGDGDRPEEVALGIFTPGAGDAPLKGRVPDLAGRTLALEIRSSPAHPENIDFCTVDLKDLDFASLAETPRRVR